MKTSLHAFIVGDKRFALSGHTWFIVFIALSMSLQAHAGSVFKCTNEEGRTAYSQFPCGEDSKKIELESNRPAPSDPADNNAGDSPSDIGSLSRKSTRKYLIMKIESIDKDIESLKKQGYKRIEKLRADLINDPYNKYGKSRAVKIQTQIDHLYDYYQQKVDKKDQEKAKVQQKLADLPK